MFSSVDMCGVVRLVVLEVCVKLLVLMMCVNMCIESKVFIVGGFLVGWYVVLVCVGVVLFCVGYRVLCSGVIDLLCVDVFF